MKCRYNRRIYEKESSGYCVYTYLTDDEGVPQAARNRYFKGDGIEFSAVGINLPSDENIEVDLTGKWVKNPKYGFQLSVEAYTELLPQTEEGIKGYLASGMIKGIGPQMAERIVGRFGTRTFEVFENYPDSLLEIKGISQKKLDTILVSYHGSHAMRDLAAFLSPFNVTPKKIQKIYEEFGNEALETVKNQPFTLCQIHGFGFLTVDAIAKTIQCRPDDSMRIEGCIRYCMEQENQEGNLYCEKEVFQKKVYDQLNQGYTREVVTPAIIYQELYRLVQEAEFYYEKGAFYSARFYEYECGAAKALAGLLVQEETTLVNIDFLIAEAQRELGINLSGKQMEGVKKAFASMVSIITGGPGTGKTTVEQIILYIREKLGVEMVLLVAPTGRASRRMAECTGFTGASTMHSALGLTNEELDEEREEMLEAQLILSDEFSMVDMRLGYEFFSHIRKGTRLILIGDINQLPSVGPGNVFRELIQCGVIPVTVLDMVFRQKENSRIALNAYRMLKNDVALEYGADFVFIPVKSAAEAADTIEKLYLDAVTRLDTDQVQVLTPYRKKGDASVNALNERLWNLVNPPAVDKREIKSGSQVFRVGDKIIHNKNKNGISNGDTGFISDIYLDEDGVELARLDFSDGRSVEYTSDELEMVEHAYAITVHKSQGSEYPVIILPWIPMFYKMLRRNILYTAITRAKAQVFLVGDKRAIYRAIHNTESDKRNTMLGERIIREYNMLLEDRNENNPIKANQIEDYEQLAINF